MNVVAVTVIAAGATVVTLISVLNATVAKQIVLLSQNIVCVIR